jgi:SAM-dependent methyltransferase
MATEKDRLDAKNHWEELYHSTSPGKVSWYQENPATSLDFIEKTGLPKEAPILDVGSGASTLIDQLLLRGYRNLALLDVSTKALLLTRQRLGGKATGVAWHHGDVTRYSLPEQYSLWHDRAAFHFLVDPSDRRAYVTSLRQGLRPQGHLILATFAVGGPTKCSGLDVTQYDTQKITTELGQNFRLIETLEELHQTPAGVEQLFSYFWFTRDR